MGWAWQTTAVAPDVYEGLVLGVFAWDRTARDCYCQGYETGPKAAGGAVWLDGQPLAEVNMMEPASKPWMLLVAPFCACALQG